MKKNIPYSYFKSTLLAIWVLALLSIAGTWTTFMVGNDASIAFGLVTDILLAIMLILLAVLMIVSGRPDYQKKSWMVILATVIHIGFFVTVMIIQAINGQSQELYDVNFFEPAWAFALGHTIILLAAAGIGLYLWIRNRFSFKSFAEKDAVAAFGKPINGVEPQPVKEPLPTAALEPEEPKVARDEKTGIVSL